MTSRLEAEKRRKNEEEFLGRLEQVQLAEEFVFSLLPYLITNFVVRNVWGDGIFSLTQARNMAECDVLIAAVCLWK
jgi:hypothetical protein